MPWKYPPEVKAAVRKLVEDTAMPFVEIGALNGVAGSTVSTWKLVEGWTRPDSAFARKPVPKAERAAATRILATGANHADVALLMHRDPAYVRTLRPPRAAAASVAPNESPAMPAQVAALYEALTAGAIGRDELIRHTPQALALVIAETLVGRNLLPDRKAQAIARAAAIAAKLPGDAPAPGASSHDDPHAGPATYDETNAILEEIAERYRAFRAGRDADRVRGETLPEGAAVHP